MVAEMSWHRVLTLRAGFFGHLMQHARCLWHALLARVGDVTSYYI